MNNLPAQFKYCDYLCSGYLSSYVCTQSHAAESSLLQSKLVYRFGQKGVQERQNRSQALKRTNIHGLVSIMTIKKK
jgi:hypothetical protein